MGLLTASVVVLLLVGSGAAALEGSPDADGAASPLERIVVEEDALGLREGLAGGGPVLGRVPGGAGGDAGDGGAGDGHAGGGLSDSGTGSGTLDVGAGGGTLEGGSPDEPAAGAGREPPGAGSPGNTGRDAGHGGRGVGAVPLTGPVGDTVGGALDGVAPGLGALR
ncbi:MAG TPA: hypothetical protein VFY47_04450 [Thermoleophilaceae bacterium]|nr:hypothetical protein [Thermoleophilaceae bacterium]